MNKKVYDISSGSWEEVNEIRSLPLSYEQIIGKCVVGLVCYVTTPAGYQTAYTNAESKKLRAIFNFEGDIVGIDNISIPAVRDLIELESTRKSRLSCSAHIHTLEQDAIKARTASTKEIEALRADNKRLLTLVDTLKIEKEEYKLKLEAEISDRHEFVITYQNTEIAALVTQKKEMQDLIDDLYIKLSAAETKPLIKKIFG